MELQQALAVIKQHISQGNLEQALTDLVVFLEKEPQYAELAQIARVNQADLYQLKAQMLKATIANEDARLAMNQVADNTLQIVRRLESGKLTFADENVDKPTRSTAWRYYVVGGIVTLALAIVAWKFFGGGFKTRAECPEFGENKTLRVMILPFKQTGNQKTFEPEFDIADGLNDLIGDTPGLKIIAEADVNESYNIEGNYPNPSEAADLARQCNVEMIVWGKVQQQVEGKDYTVDVRYKLLDPGGVRLSGDTTINRLLATSTEGGWQQDVQAITQLLYFKLANKAGAPIAARLLENMTDESVLMKSATAGDTSIRVDTSKHLTLAEVYTGNKQLDKAIAEYDKVLEVFPNHTSALQKRGALLYYKGDFDAAARDLEAATPASGAASADLKKVRVDAFLKSGQPEKAQKELQRLDKKAPEDGAWIRKKNQEAGDSTVALKRRLEKIEKMAAAKPGDTKSRVNAAKASLGIGDEIRARRNADEALKLNPNNLTALEIKLESYLQEGDTAKAAKMIESATKAGINVKSLRWKPLTVKPLNPQ